MFSKTFLSLLTVACLTVCNSGNAAVDITFYHDKECSISCNGNTRTVDYTTGKFDEVNSIIGNYFNIESINYDTQSNTINFKCTRLEKNTNCILILNNPYTMIYDSPVRICGDCF